MWNDPTQPSSRFPADAPAPPAYAPPPGPYAPSSVPLAGSPAVKSALPARKSRRWPVILLFMALAGLIPETIVTSSTSVLKIVASPVSLVFIALFYGTADIIIREAIIRRPLGLTAKIMLGAAFGFVNEGVVAGTWYTVRPTGYVFVYGIDFAWAVSLTVFHIFISVLVPIYLIDSIAPSVAGVSLLKKRGIIICGVLFVALSSLVVYSAQYRLQRAVVFAVALALAAIALRLAPARPTPIPADAKPAPGVWILRVLGFVALLMYFICIYGMPALLAAINQRARLDPVLPGILANAALVGLVAWALALGDSWARRKGWSSRHQLALMTGLFSFSLLFSFIPNLVAVWEPFATVPFMVFLIVLAWRGWRADRRAAKVAGAVNTPLIAQTPVTPVAS